jgi:two-component system, OmpR family, sensor histidine kinase CreC
MHLGIRLLFGFFLITGLAAFFVLRVFMAEVKPSVREVMEDVMVDTANILAEIASDDMASGALAKNELGQSASRFTEHVRNYARRPIDAQIWGLDKQSLDFRVYVTDVTGTVLFDSENIAVGQDYSRWRDVARTLRGEYGARATREVQQDDKSAVMYVAAPISKNGNILGVLTVAKPIATIQGFIDRAELKIFWSGALLLVLSLAIGVVVTLWLVANIRKLRNYANAVAGEADGLPLRSANALVPRMPGELGELARAMESMRIKLEGQAYVETYVRALTHELKSPLAAIRGAGELLQDELPPAARREFADTVLSQAERLQAMVDQMLQLTKLEQGHGQLQLEMIQWREFFTQFESSGLNLATVSFEAAPDHTGVHADRGMLTLALSNLLQNAQAFAPPGSTITVQASADQLVVQDQGPGVPDYALARLGERFYSTARPNPQGTALTKGSGLGLAMVRQIMRLHGGTMAIHNTTPGLRVVLNF